MGLIGKAHGYTLANQEKFSSGGFGSVATSPLFAASSSSSSNQTSLELAATGPSAFPPPLFGAASSSNISNPAIFELALTGPSANPPPLFGAASSSNNSNPANFELVATGASASPPPLFGVASSSNISNPVNFGFEPTGPSVFRPPFFYAAASSNTTSPSNFALAGTGASIFGPPLFDSASSSSNSSPANFGFSAGPSLFRPSLFAASSRGNSSTQALSWPAVLPPCTSSLFALENPTATSTSPVFCSSSSNMRSLPKQSLFAPSTDNAVTVANPPVFGCGLIVNSSSGSSGVSFSSTPSYCFLNVPQSQTDSFPVPSAPASSIFTTSATATVLPAEDSSNKQASSFGSFRSLAGPSTVGFSSSLTKVPFATTTNSTMANPSVSKCEFWPPINSSNAPPSFDFSGTPLHCFAKIPSLSQKDSQPAQPFSSIFPTATTTTIFPAGGEEVRKPTPHLCPSCGQTLLTGTVYRPTLTPDKYQPGWLQSISAMPENETKNHEELRWANHLLQGVPAMPENQAKSHEELGWGNHLQGKAKDAAAPVAHQSTISSQPQWTLPVMVLPVMQMPLPSWSTLHYTPTLASTLPAFPANGAAFGYAYSPSLSGTPMMPAVFNLCDMFRHL